MHILLHCSAFALLVLPVFLLAEPLIRTLFSPVYVSSAHLFRILFWGSLTSMLVYPANLVLYATNRGWTVALGNLIQLTVAVAGYLYLTASYGAEGTAWSAVGGRFAGCAFFVLAVVRAVRTRGDEPADTKFETAEVVAG
jgi:O-antigen/teichoic acid export membrane protein